MTRAVCRTVDESEDSPEQKNDQYDDGLFAFSRRHLLDQRQIKYERTHRYCRVEYLAQQTRR